MALAGRRAIGLWGGNAIATKVPASGIDPVSITFYRWLAATVLIAPFAIPQLVRQHATMIANLPRLIILGLLGSALFPFLMCVLVQRWRTGLPLIAELFVQAAAACLALSPVYLAGRPGIPQPAARPMIV